MRYLLDTNICIFFLRGEFGINDRINQVGAQHCSISEITLAELVYGAECSSQPVKNHKLIDLFIREISILPIFSSIREYAGQKSRLRKQGSLISDFDLLIGASAIQNGLVNGNR